MSDIEERNAKAAFQALNAMHARLLEQDRNLANMHASIVGLTKQVQDLKKDLIMQRVQNAGSGSTVKG